MNGKILDSVGFRKTDGVIRQLTIREQLLQVKNFKGINTINHPVHGKIDVDRSKVEYLLAQHDGDLYRYKKSIFE